MNRIIVKHILRQPTVVAGVEPVKDEQEVVTSEEKKNKKGKKKEEDMMNEEILSAAEAQASNLAGHVKVTKKDRSIIERAESSKIILTEDNRQILND